MADPERLYGVLEHLIRNAQDAIQDDGEVTITVEQLDASARTRRGNTLA